MAAVGMAVDYSRVNAARTAFQSALDATALMVSKDATNQRLGLQLGWASLVGGGPFPVPPPKDPLYIYTDVIILLTDGLNTQNRWSTDQNTIDTREAMTCSNLRNAHVDVYTIQVNTGGDPTSTLLQNCASTSDKFFLLTSADQMTATFNKIGTNLTKLRVAQ